MIGFIIFILVCLFVNAPLHTSFRKSQACGVLNAELIILATRHDSSLMQDNFLGAEACHDKARDKVRFIARLFQVQIA